MKARAQVKKTGAEFSLSRGRAIDLWCDAYARTRRPHELAAEMQIAHATPESGQSVGVYEHIAEAAGEVALLAAQMPEDDPARDRILDLASRSLVIGTFPEHITKEGSNE